jgi:hypothetical protein
MTCGYEERTNDFDGWENFSYNQAAGIIPFIKERSSHERVYY